MSLALAYFVEVEHQVQLTHTAEVLIEHLDEQMDELHGHYCAYLEDRQLIVGLVHAQRKEQPCVAPVDDLVVAELGMQDLSLPRGSWCACYPCSRSGGGPRSRSCGALRPRRLHTSARDASCPVCSKVG